MAELRTVSAAGGRALRVLLVDDDKDMRALIRQVLRLADHGLAIAGEATDAVTALEQWTALQPDVIVMDQRMPGRTGLELADVILGRSPKQPIILFSAHLDVALIDRANAIGVCSTLEKARYRDLPATIRECVSPS
jgi:CheY-like chemotaxis protein